MSCLCNYYIVCIVQLVYLVSTLYNFYSGVQIQQCLLLLLQPFHSTWGEHRPLTTFFHFLLSWAWFSASFRPWSFSSLSSCLLQVFLGLPTFRWPWGFHFRLYFVILSLSFLRVWPSHLNFLFLIWMTIFSWLVLSHRSLFLMIFGQNILRILFKHLLIKTCSLSSCFLLRNHGGRTLDGLIGCCYLYN